MLKVSGFLIILIDIYEFDSCGSRPKSSGKSTKFGLLDISPFVLPEIK